jgi:peptide/nickel transport system permease protein
MRWRHVLTPWRAVMLAILLGFVVMAIVGPAIWGADADRVDIAATSQGASVAHPFGTDALGRDMLARTLVATRLSLVLALAVAIIAVALGLLLGVVPVLLGRRTHRWASAVINLLNAFPAVLLALLVIAVIGIGWQGAVLALAIAGAPGFARMAQTLAAQEARADYVAAARLAGVRTHRLVLAHVLPNMAAPLLLRFAMACGASLLALSALSFLGVGVQEPDYDWGALLNVGLDRIYVAPAAALGPAAAIVLASVAFNVLGDALADAFATEARHPRRRRGAVAPPVPPVRAAVQHDGDAVLRVEGLSVTFPGPEGGLTPVRDVSIQVRPGERVGIVGESGSGKSLTVRASAQLVEAPGTVTAALIEVDGTDLASLPASERERHLATSVAMVFQDPLSSLNPALRVGRQVTEAAEIYLDLPPEEVRRRAVERFRELGIAGGARRLRQYPHELSGGMRQRAVIAMGLMNEPRIILADEPTSALDVTVQRQVLRKLRQVNEERGTAIVLISHDIAVVGAFCERVLVMYAGRIVEELDTAALADAAHPYTRALVAAVPDMAMSRDRPLAAIPGQPPAVAEAPAGCSFAARCPFATQRCHAERPPLSALADRHRAACWHPRDPVGARAHEGAA